MHRRVQSGFSQTRAERARVGSAVSERPGVEASSSRTIGEPSIQSITLNPANDLVEPEQSARRHDKRVRDHDADRAAVGDDRDRLALVRHADVSCRFPEAAGEVGEAFSGGELDLGRPAHPGRVDVGMGGDDLLEETTSTGSNTASGDATWWPTTCSLSLTVRAQVVLRWRSHLWRCRTRSRARTGSRSVRRRPRRGERIAWRGPSR